MYISYIYTHIYTHTHTHTHTHTRTYIQSWRLHSQFVWPWPEPPPPKPSRSQVYLHMSRARRCMCSMPAHIEIQYTRYIRNIYLRARRMQVYVHICRYNNRNITEPPPRKPCSQVGENGAVVVEPERDTSVTACASAAHSSPGIAQVLLAASRALYTHR